MCELGSRRKCKCARGNQDIVIHPARLCNGCYSAGACCTTCSNDQGSDSEDLFHKANEKNTGKNKKQKKAERDEEARKKADEEARKNAERDEASKKADEEARKNAEDTRKKKADEDARRVAEKAAAKKFAAEKNSYFAQLSVANNGTHQQTSKSEKNAGSVTFSSTADNVCQSDQPRRNQELPYVILNGTAEKKTHFIGMGNAFPIEEWDLFNEAPKSNGNSVIEHITVWKEAPKMLVLQFENYHVKIMDDTLDQYKKNSWYWQGSSSVRFEEEDEEDEGGATCAANCSETAAFDQGSDSVPFEPENGDLNGETNGPNDVLFVSGSSQSLSPPQPTTEHIDDVSEEEEDEGGATCAANCSETAAFNQFHDTTISGGTFRGRVFHLARAPGWKSSKRLLYSDNTFPTVTENCSGDRVPNAYVLHSWFRLSAISIKLDSLKRFWCVGTRLVSNTTGKFDGWVLMGILVKMCVRSVVDFLVLNTKDNSVEVKEKYEFIKNYTCDWDHQYPPEDFSELEEKVTQHLVTHSIIYDERKGHYIDVIAVDRVENNLLGVSVERLR